MRTNQKYIIIALVAVIAVLAIGIGYMLLNPGVEYQTINLSNGTTIEVPKADDANWTINEYGIRMYGAPSKKTSVMSFNSQEDFSLVGAGGFALARDALMNGSVSLETYKNYDIHEGVVNGTHYYMVYISNAQTHDNIFLGSADLGILKHMIDSIVFGQPAGASVNATGESHPVAVSDNASNENTYSEDDLMRAAQEGYYTGYSDGYDDSSYYDDYDYDDYDYSSSSYSSSSDSSSESSDVETSVDDNGNLE